MKQKLFYVFFFIVTALPVTLRAKTYTISDVPNVRLTDIHKYVADPEFILSQEATDSINTMLYRLEKKTGIETAVVVLPSIGDEDSFDFAYSLGRAWGVGKKKKDNGLVILLVIDQRRVQFATGYGLEGYLPDAICKQIQMQEMVPAFKHDDWNKGMIQGVKTTCSILDGSMKATDVGSEEDSSDIIFVGLFFACLIGGACIFIFIKNRNANRCPVCGKHQLQRTNSYLLSNKGGVKTETVVYTCQHCGHKIERKQRSYDENYRGRGFGGPFIGGGGFGGGGDFGGSFGGGNFGGGGSGSSF